MFHIEVLLAIKDLVLSPFREPSLLWQLAPLLILWLIIGFYFAFHKEEKLGWNTALGNGITLFWIAVSAMQHIFSNGQQFFTWLKFAILLFITLYAALVIYASFEHAFSSKLTYFLASHNIIYYLSILSLLYAYDMIYFSLPMFVAIIFIFLFIVLVDRIVRRFVPDMDTGDALSSDDFVSDTPSSSETQTPTESASEGGIETQMANKPLSQSRVKY